MSYAIIPIQISLNIEVWLPFQDVRALINQVHDSIPMVLSGI